MDLPSAVRPDDASTWVSPDGAFAATTRGAGRVVVIDMSTGEVVRRLPAVPGSSERVGAATVQGWTSSGLGIVKTRTLPGEDPPADITVIDAADGAVRWHADLPAFANEAVADPSGRVIAVGLDSGSVLFLDAASGAQLAAPAVAVLGWVANVSASPDGRWFSASGGPPAAHRVGHRVAAPGGYAAAPRLRCERRAGPLRRRRPTRRRERVDHARVHRRHRRLARPSLRRRGPATHRGRLVGGAPDPPVRPRLRRLDLGRVSIVLRVEAGIVGV